MPPWIMNLFFHDSNSEFFFLNIWNWKIRLISFLEIFDIVIRDMMN